LDKEDIMAKSDSEIFVYFAGLEESAKPPASALYLIDENDVPSKKLGNVIDGALRIEGSPPKGAVVAIGPDVKTPSTIDPESLLRYRFDEVIDGWRERGIFLPQDRWTLLLREIVCVSGRVRKCRPWWFDRIASPIAALSQQSFAQRSLALQLTPAQGFAELLYPRWCVPLCDGIVEVWERKCCCHHFHIDHLLDRLRDVLERVPIDIDWPIPPEPEPWGPIRDRLGPVSLNPQPLPPVDGPRLRAKVQRSRAVVAAKRFDPGQTYVSERVLEDYHALRAMPRADTAAYIEARPYLYAHICTCTMKKVGQVAIQPDGEFDFCYWRPRQFHHLHHHQYHHCHTSYAYRVKQLIGGIWTVVYDGVAGKDYYGQGEQAEIRTTSPKARPCGQGPNPPHEGDGLPYVILQNVTGQYTNHFNFPLQTDVSRVGPLSAANAGLYDLAGVPDCPWAQTLHLRLWSSPLLKDIVVYYRLKVAKVNAAGQAVGAFQTLKNAVTWQRHDGGSKTTESLAVAPSDVSGEDGLYKFPYEGDGKNWFWVDYHQSWDTTLFDPDGSGPAEAVADGHFMLVMEVFGAGGVRIKPNGAAGPGADRAFQFRRWTDPDDTVNVPFADCAHIFRVNNEAVVGKIENLRKDGAPNNAQCQFMSGNADTEFSIGFRAYHDKGVTIGGGLGDTNSFMRFYGISWQRGLGGPSESLESGTADQGEGGIEESNSATFGDMLDEHVKCTFSVHLNVYGKHHNGSSFLYGNGFYYNETASFALDVTPTP
jgi:hypothetical protein